MKIIDSSI